MPRLTTAQLDALPDSSNAASPVDGYISEAAKTYDIDPLVLRAVGEQESGLGTSGSYDPKTGRSRTAGNAGHGIFQLDPASGATQADLDRAARDPRFATLYAARMLAHNYKVSGRNWTSALATYNAGNAASQAGLDYAKAVLARVPQEHSVPVLRGNLQETVDRVARGEKSKRSHLQKLSRTVPGRLTTDQLNALPDAAPSPSPAPAGRMSSAQLDALPDSTQPAKPKFGLSAAQQLAQFLYQRGLGDYRHLARMGADAANDPISILNAVVGAPGRFITGGMQADTQHNKPDFSTSLGTYKNSFDQLGSEAHGGLSAVLHPNDQTVLPDAEKAAGVDKLKQNMPAVLPIGPGYSPVVIPPGVVNALIDFGFQTGTDPLTYLGVPVKEAGEAVLGGVRSAGTAMLRSGNPKVRNLAGSFIPHDDVQAAFTPRGKAAVVGIRNSQDALAQKMAHEDEQLLKQYKDEIAAGTVPPAVRQRLLREPYVYGTPKMRAEALAQGYKPTAEEAAANGGRPYGILNHNVRADYFPHVGNHRAPEEYQAVGKAYNITPNAKFEKAQTSTALPQDPLDSMQYRLTSGRNIIRHRMIQQRIAQETGLGVKVGKTTIAPDQALINAHVHNLRGAQNILDGTQGVSSVKTAEFMKDLSDVGRDTLVGSSPFPHAKNIGFLGYLSGGIPVVVRGIKYALEGVPEHIAQWLEKNGASTHFALSQPSSFSPVRFLGPVRKYSAQILDRFDTGMRAAAYERVIKEHPNLSPFEQAEKINEDIGAYKDSPAYVEALRGWVGAQFPQWHSYIVPTAVGRAVLRHPQRVESVARAQGDINQDVIGPQAGYGINLGGPVNEFGSALAAPGELAAGENPKYFTGPSMTGVASPFFGKTSQPQSFGPTDGAKDVPGGSAVWSELIPYWNVIAPQLNINAFGSKAPKDVRSLAALFAAYPQAAQSVREKYIRDLMEQQHLDRFQAEMRYTQILRLIHRSR